MTLGKCSFHQFLRKDFTANLLRGSFIVCCLTGLVLSAPRVCALSQDDDIDTNRPSFSDSPLVVPKGSLQVENGTLYQHFQHGTNYYDIPETEVRLGVFKNTEFQMFVPQWVRLQTNSTSAIGIANTSPSFAVLQAQEASVISGASDLGEIGIKQQLNSPFKSLNLAVIGGINAPTGNSVLSGKGVQPVMRAVWSKSVTKTWSVGGMQSIIVLNAGRDVQWQNFSYLTRAIGARLSLFIEYAGFYTHHAAPSNIIHFGVVRKLNKNNQIDVHFGFGLNEAAPAAFVGAGYSFRFDRLPLIKKL
jgi:hypothetical protein